MIPPHPANRPELALVVAATYTAEPIEAPLAFWIDALGFEPRVVFAPYHQLLQQLLNPDSLFGSNAKGMNLALVRVEDFARARADGWDEVTIRQGVADLAAALVGFAGRSNAPVLVVVTPPSPRLASDEARSAFLAEMGRTLHDAIAPVDSLHWLDGSEVAAEMGALAHDSAADRVGHMPYTSLYDAGLSTIVARRVHLLRSSPYKVIALDCDNTLWKGVVGEDGVEGIGLGPGMKALQEFVVAQQASGMVVCLVSKNAEADVLQAFDARADFPLRRDHLVSWRIGWGAKSAALIELAEELNLGLDSFVFLDDNPVECAEVRAALPQVLTLQVPDDEGLAGFLRHAWAFDRLQVTDEDRGRTRMYRENAERSRVESQVSDIGTFLASLELKIAIAPPHDDQWTRLAQLSQRTNQFNFSTIRRTEAEVRRLGESSREALCVEVSDRFGDYGLVGVMIFAADGDALDVDTMLLSCRVLGRGVEHAMLAHLGQLARQRGLASLRARFVPSPKNEPALNFLKGLPDVEAIPDEAGEGIVYRLPVATAATLVYRPGGDAKAQLELARTGGKQPAKAVREDKSDLHARIIAEWHRPEAVLEAVEAATTTRRRLDTKIVPPFTAVQRQLVDLWRKVLHVDQVGVRDDFAGLGGTSLKAARLFVEIEAQFGVRLPMTTILDAPTIEELAESIAAAGRGEGRDSVKTLKRGSEGGPALFLVHDGDSETLLYLNLARRLPGEVSVYGLEPLGDERSPIRHTRIPEMAGYYIGRIREIQPEGPYLLGGMCAGGTIAFEMALQLRAAGQPVGFVALFDAAAPHAKPRPFHDARLRLRKFLGSVRGGTPRPIDREDVPEAGATPVLPAATASRPGRLARKARLVAGKLGSLAAYEVEARLRRRATAASVRVLRDALDRSEPFPDGLDFPSFRKVYERSERDYHPAGRLDAPVLLFRAGAGGHDDPSDEPFIQRYVDSYFGWGRHVAGDGRGIEVVDVPGGHGGMLQEPHVAALATPIAASIERCLVLEAAH